MNKAQFLFEQITKLEMIANAAGVISDNEEPDISFEKIVEC